MLVYPGVFDHEMVVFAAGTQTESLRVRTEDLFAGEDIHVAGITRGADGAERPHEFDGEADDAAGGEGGIRHGWARR